MKYENGMDDFKFVYGYDSLSVKLVDNKQTRSLDITQVQMFLFCYVNFRQFCKTQREEWAQIL